MKYVVTLRDRTFEIEVENGEALLLDEYEAKAPVGNVAAGVVPAAVAAAPVAAAPVAPAAAAGEGTPVPAPMPGNIISIDVKVGDAVAEDQAVAVMEAMKMNVEIVTPCAGTVKQIVVEKGAVVATSDAIMII